MIKHKHEREIVAWANGAEIEFKPDLASWGFTPSPMWANVGQYRVKPDCEYAFEVMKAHGILDMYDYWLAEGEVTAEHRSGTLGGKLIPWKANLDPFHYFLDASECHELSKKVVKIKKWLWIQVVDDRLVDHCYLIESDVDNISDLLGYTGWIKTEHFVEVAR